MARKDSFMFANRIGIDLGTSNSQAAVVIGGKPTIIPSAEGATVGLLPKKKPPFLVFRLLLLRIFL